MFVCVCVFVRAGGWLWACGSGCGVCSWVSLCACVSVCVSVSVLVFDATPTISLNSATASLGSGSRLTNSTWNSQTVSRL